MTFLLDVNVLIALIDPYHDRHDDAHDWFAAQGRRAWATLITDAVHGGSQAIHLIS